MYLLFLFTFLGYALVANAFRELAHGLVPLDIVMFEKVNYN